MRFPEAARRVPPPVSRLPVLPVAMRTVLTLWAVTLLDQATKHWVQQRFLCNERQVILPGWFDLRYVRNTGAAWGLLAGFQPWLVLFSLAMIVLVVRARRTLFGDIPLGWLSMGCLLSGIAGNLIDRVRLGYVVDFFDFYRGETHFPVFNVADSAITAGVALYLFGHWIAGRRARAVSPAPTD